MPTYQYACTNPKGKHEFDVVQSFTDEPLTACTVCGQPVRKVYGSVGVVFKGSGFYRTDSRAGSGKKGAGESSSSPKSSDSSSTSSSSGSSSSTSGSSTSSSAGGGTKAAAS